MLRHTKNIQVPITDRTHGQWLTSKSIHAQRESRVRLTRKQGMADSDTRSYR